VTFTERTTKHISELNEAWQTRRFHDIAAYYDPNVVLLPPDAGEAIVGRDAVVASYNDFAAADLNEFVVEGFEVFEFDDTGICHLRFLVEYTLDGSRYRERGLEVYVVANVNTSPQIIWRSQSLTEVSDIKPHEAESE
jgi:ketosteroid isomerase-like protein